MSLFSYLGLEARLQKALQKRGFDSATPVQVSKGGCTGHRRSYAL